MLVGPSTSDKIVVTSSAAATVWISGSTFVVSTASPPVPDGAVTRPLISASIGAASRDVLVGAASLIKRLTEMTIRNAHASTSTDITVTRTDGTNTPEVFKCTLLAGEHLAYNGAGSWLHYDSNGGLYPSVGNSATQAEMEAGTSTSKYVTPLGVNFHPGVAKAWAKSLVTATVPQMTVTWNITSITDSAVCRVAPVIATDFSSANYAIMYGFECNTTTYSATTVACIQTIRNATQAAGGFTMDLIEIDIGQTTDPAAWHWVCFGDQ